MQTTNLAWDNSSNCGRKTTETVVLQTPGGSISKHTTFAYSNTYTANPVTVKEWNYYTGSPSANPDRITNISYLSDSNSAYAPYGSNILNLRSSVVVTDGSSTELAETDYSYDTTTVGSKTGIYHHDDANYGTTFTARESYGDQSLERVGGQLMSP